MELEENILKLTAIMRLTKSLGNEMQRDGDLFGQERHDKFIEMSKTAKAKRDVILRSFIILDCMLVLFISGRNIIIPGTDTTTAGLPALLEITTFAATTVFLYVANAMFNLLCYNSIVSQFNILLASKSGVDPDFLTASEIEFQFFTKVFRNQFNFWNAHSFEPGWGYKAFSKFVYISLLFTVGTFLLAHFALILYSLYTSIENYGFTVIIVVYSVVITILNLATLSLLLLQNKYFTFYKTS